MDNVLLDERSDSRIFAPATEADIRLLLGDQRSGKSNSMVAFAKDDYYDQLTGIMSPSGGILKAKSLTTDDKKLLERKDIHPNVFKYVRVFNGKESKITKIPIGWTVESPVRIFANFHLYGLRYCYITLADIIQYLNSDVFHNAWILSDESVMTDARNSMTNAGIIIATLGATVGKRNIHFCQSAQYNEMVERRFRLFATTRVLCSYEPKTKMITLDIKKRGANNRSVSYYAPIYWRNFDTNELIKVPEKKLARALESVAY